MGDVSAWGSSGGFEVLSDISSSDAEPRLGDKTAAGGGGGGGRAKDHILGYSKFRMVIYLQSVGMGGGAGRPLGVGGRVLVTSVAATMRQRVSHRNFEPTL